MPKDVTADSAAIADVLNRAEYATLALADDQGLYSVPVNVAFREGVLYLHTGKKGRKFEALAKAEREGTKIAFSAAVDLEMKTGDKACQWGYTFRSVFGSGTVRIVKEGPELRAGLGVIMQKYAKGDGFPYDDKILGITAVVAIRVDAATARLKQS